jgi:hypothetical protein
MFKAAVVFLVVLILGVSLAGAYYAGYNGIGMISAGGPSARVGSIGGPIINTGGTGSGK